MPSPKDVKPKPSRAGYPRIPDQSDLRGFSYRAPTNLTGRDEGTPPKGIWYRLLERLGLGRGRHD